MKRTLVLSVLLITCLIVLAIPCTGLAEETYSYRGNDFYWKRYSNRARITGCKINTGTSVEVPGEIPGDSGVLPVELYKTFYNNQDIEEVTVHSGAVIVGQSAFYKCGKLNTVLLPKNLETIGSSAFSYCTSLKKIDLPFVKLKSIGTSAFKYSGLAQIEIPSSVKKVDSSAFYGCKSLESATMDEVTEIGTSAFRNCVKLTSVKLPNTLTKVGTYVFSGCTKLNNVTIPSSLKTIGSYMFNGCSSLANLTIKEGVEKINSSAFYKCGKLQSLKLPDSLTYLGSSAFKYCYDIESVVLPEKLGNLYISTFYKCSSLERVDVKNSDTKFASSSTIFKGCNNKFVLYGYKGSTAQEHAEKYGYEFCEFGQRPTYKVRLSCYPESTRPGYNNKVKFSVSGAYDSSNDNYYRYARICFINGSNPNEFWPTPKFTLTNGSGSISRAIHVSGVRQYKLQLMNSAAEWFDSNAGVKSITVSNATAMGKPVLTKSSYETERGKSVRIEWEKCASDLSSSPKTAIYIRKYGDKTPELLTEATSYTKYTISSSRLKSSGTYFVDLYAIGRDRQQSAAATITIIAK